MGEAGLGGGFGLGEEIFRAIGELASEGGLTGLVGQGRLVGTVAGLAGKGEGSRPFDLSVPN